MEKKWFTTVGFVGGEFAMLCEDLDTMQKSILGLIVDDHYGINEASVETGFCWRPAPPDLAEWLDAEMHVEQRLDKNAYGPDSRTKVPGGWFYAGGAGESAAAVFVPVAGSANITIIAGDQ